MKKVFKAIIRKAVGWYIAPIEEQNLKQSQQLKELEENYKTFLSRISELLQARDADFNAHNEWMRGQLERQEEKFVGIAEREEWTRQRFAEQEEKFAGIAEREEWTRQRFAEIQHNFNASLVNSSEGKQSFAQSGEDMIISYVLHFLQKPISEVTYLDLGANHAKELSNTYHFYQMGAKGVLLEANPELIHELEQVRSRDIILNRSKSICSNIFSSIPSKSIDKIVSSCGKYVSKISCI